MQRLVYLTRNYKGTSHGGGKARVDMEDILAGMGAVNLGLKRTFYRNPVIDFALTFSGVLKFCASVRKGDVVILQYPVKKYYRIICRVARMKGARVITLIHDLGCFRRRKLTVAEEMKKLALSDVLIPANVHMIKWLKDHGCKEPMTDQQVWDYRSESNPVMPVQPADTCLFVGDLRSAHNGYLYKLPQSLKIHLYGPGAPKELPGNIIHHGLTPSDDIIAGSEGRYGLLWYGTGLEHDKTEFIGEYIRICNPHKLALYMLAGKPVVMWSQAADADFVREEGVGITVDSLLEIDKRLSEISDEEYQTMVSNCHSVAAKMKEGFFIRTALERALKLLPEPR